MKRLLPAVARRSESGAAMVELAFALPVLAILLIGTADFARVFHLAMALTNAARAGAQYGAKNLGGGATAAEMEAAAMGSVNVPVLAQASQRCECADPGATTFTAIDCTLPATTCTGATFRVITITVTTRQDFTTVAPYLLVPRPLSLQRVAVMRVTE
jgi:Flp pilus assembly protein TadG